MRALHFSTIALLVGATSAAAQQQPAKKVLTQAAFDSWRSIQGARLSNDGKWAVYSLVPQVGDGEVVVRQVPSGPEYRATRGFIGRPQTRAGAQGPPGGATPPAEVTSDSRFVIFTMEPSKDEVDKARREKRRPTDQPRPQLGIMSLADGKVTIVPRVRSFRLAKDAPKWVAYLLEPRDSTGAARAPRDSAAQPAGAAAATPGGRARPIAADSSRAGGPRREYGSALVLRDLSSGTEVTIDDVTAYSFDDRGAWLGYTVSSRTASKDGAYARSLADGKVVTLAAGKGIYRNFVFGKRGAQVAFVSDRDEQERPKPRFALYEATLPAGQARVLVPASAFGDSMIVSSAGRLDFSDDGKSLQFGVALAAPDSIPADSLADKAVFDLWNYKDARLQPQQRVEAGRDRDRSFPAVYLLDAGKYRVVGNDSMPSVRFSRDDRTALALTNVPYAVEAMWGEGGNDVYLIDVATGARKLVKKRANFQATLSPDNRYVMYFDDGHWYTYAVATGKTVDLTAKTPGVHFDQETWDTPSEPAPWGVGGWTKGDGSVLVYDRYDVWELDPAGVRAARVVTDSAGRRERLTFRIVAIDTSDSGNEAVGGRGGRGGGANDASIDPARPLLLRTINEDTKASGFYRDRIGANTPPIKVMMTDRAVGTPTKARHADTYLFTQGTFVDFPNLYVSGANFTDAQRISDANPQQKDYKWGTAQLVTWRSGDGIPLKGILYKPADFDPKKKYPLIAYFYEQLSENLNSYVPPAGRNVINPTVYASNGYLVFEPDIHYETGYPGPSALKSIVPGVQMLIDSGFVNPGAVGLQGQSWGGYQTAYMITQTSMFKAAMAGAPVANMTSAYGGIRWQTGLARAFQYEKTQSRIGGSLWQYPMRYIENSPLFSADRITTPLLIMSNDGDGSVPWYQGIEMFVALRRLGKEVYLIDYNGDEHNPTKRANQLDIAMRMQQFFDHHLKGLPAPAWMEKGIPFLQKGRDQISAASQAPVQGGSVPVTPQKPETVPRI